MPQVLPLGCLVLPRRFGHLPGRDDEYPADLQPVIEELVDGGQGHDGLAESHLHPEGHSGLFQNGLDARLLIRVRVKLLHCFDLRFF